jgi:hypothetical protein
MMKKLKVLLGALSLLTVGATNASSLVLDSFNYNPALDLNVDAGVTTHTGSVISAESGAIVTYTLNYTGTQSGINTATGNLVNASPGQLSYSETALSDGTLNIAYSFGGGFLDVTGFDAFYFDVLAIDGSGGFNVTLTLTDDDGTTVSADYTVNSTGIFNAGFSAMTIGTAGTTAGFDLSQVIGAQANITSAGVLGNDFILDSVGLVPEPSALAVLGLGLIGLGLRRRKGSRRTPSGVSKSLHPKPNPGLLCGAS